MLDWANGEGAFVGFEAGSTAANLKGESFGAPPLVAGGGPAGVVELPKREVGGLLVGVLLFP